MSYFILHFGHFAFNFGVLWVFYRHYFTQEHPLKFFSFSLTLLKILSVNIMLEPIFFDLFHCLTLPVKYINVGENQLFSWEKSHFCPFFFGGKSYFCPIFHGCYVLFFFDLSYYWYRDIGLFSRVTDEFCITRSSAANDGSISYTKNMYLWCWLLNSYKYHFTIESLPPTRAGS